MLQKYQMKKKLTINKESTIKDAMKLLNETGENCLLVVENNKFYGTLTDGDIRRSILSGIKTRSSIESCVNTSPVFFEYYNYDISDVKSVMLKKKIDLIPLIDKNNVVIDYLTWDKVFGKDKVKSRSSLNIPVVVMAGGKGTRMKPFTNVLPKPLIPIKDKTMIEYIISQFTDYGCEQFYISINYKSKIIKAFFDELKPPYQTIFIDEEKPLGTAGSLYQIKDKINSPFFVSNCDILINCDYSKLFNFHVKGGYDLTLVASTKEFVIPYGACEIDKNGELLKINEKPSYDFLVNTGLYILNPNITSFIPKNKFYHITHLIEDLKKQDLKIGVFPVSEDAWIDVGQWSEYQNALKVVQK